MKIKRKGNFLEAKFLFGITGLIILFYLLSTLGRREAGTTMPKNKLEAADLFRIQNVEPTDFNKFLDTYAQKGFTILFASFDNIKNNKDDAGKRLKSLGSKQIDSLKFRDSYAGVIEDGLFVKEKRSSDSQATIEHDNFVVSGLGFGKKRSNTATVGVTYVEDISNIKTSFTSRLARGMHALVYTNNGQFIKEVTTFHFDLHSEINPTSEGVKKIFLPLQDKLTIDIEEEDFNTIKEKREKALDYGLLLPGIYRIGTDTTDYRSLHLS